jgi:hypothetical protein
MFDELSSETLLSVRGGFRIDPEIANAMLSAMQQIASARDATLASLNDSVTQVLFFLAAHSRRARQPGIAPTGIAPFGTGTPMPFGPPAMDAAPTP